MSAVEVSLRPGRAAAGRLGDDRRVLVADDDPMQLKLLRLQLAEGAFDGTTPIGGGPHLLFSVPMKAVKLGVVTFAQMSPRCGVWISRDETPVRSAFIHAPFRAALSYTTRLSASVVLELEGYREVYDAIRSHDPLGARAASEKIVGLEMLAVERVIAGASEVQRP